MNAIVPDQPEITVSLVLHKLDRDYDHAVFTSDHNPLTFSLSIDEWVMFGRPVNLTITATAGNRP